MTDLAQQREPVAVGQSKVQDQRGVERRQQDTGGFLHRRQHVELIAGRLQALGQQCGQLLIVFHDQ